MSEKLPPEAREKLARALRDNLSRDRPRPWLWALVGIPLVGAILWGVYYFNRQPPGLPPLMLIAFDGVSDDHPVEAQLIAPGNPDASLGGLEIQWNGGHAYGKGAVKTDVRGLARWVLGENAVGAHQHEAEILKMPWTASFVDPAGVYRRDAAALVVNPKGPIAIVALDDLAPKTEWDKPLAEIKLPPLKIVGEDAIYCAGAVDALTYHSMRGWLQRQQSSGLPAGPLVRETAEALEARLKGRVPARRWSMEK